MTFALRESMGIGMRLTDVEVIISIAVGFVIIFTALVKIFLKLAQLSYDLGQITLKADTAWDFIIRRGQVEMMKHGWGELRSPLELSEQGYRVIQPFLSTFLPFYQNFLKFHPHPTQREAIIELERTFGDMIVETICVPHGVVMGACLVAILKACEKEVGK